MENWGVSLRLKLINPLFVNCMKLTFFLNMSKVLNVSSYTHIYTCIHTELLCLNLKITQCNVSTNKWNCYHTRSPSTTFLYRRNHSFIIGIFLIVGSLPRSLQRYLLFCGDFILNNFSCTYRESES